MKTNLLTAKELTGKALPEGELHDGGGLYLRISKIGSKAWVYRYRLGGKPKSITLGQYPQMSLAQARISAGKMRQSVALGISPAVSLQTIAQGATFGELKNLWFENIHKKQTLEKTWADDEARLNNHASDIMNMPIAAIKPSHLVSMFDPLVKKNQITQIRKTAALIRSVCDWAITQDIIQINPAAVIKKAFARPPAPKPFPYIRAEELYRVFEKSINGMQDRQSKDLLMCYILTGVRAKELVSAKWEKLKGNILTIEGQYMKNGEDFDIYLSTQAQAILERQVKKPRCPFIFPNRSKREESMSPETVTRWLRNEAGFKGQLVTHGFRKMFSTWANEQLNADETNTLYPKEIIERSLDHQDEDKIRSIYNGAIYPKLRRAVMQGWADYVGLQWQKAVMQTGLPTMDQGQLAAFHPDTSPNPRLPQKP